MRLTLTPKRWPIRGHFTLSRDSRTHIDTLQLTLEQKGSTGRAEARPYARYGETLASVSAQLGAIAHLLGPDGTPDDVQSLLPAGAARNLLDCALLHLRAQQQGMPVWQCLNLPAPAPAVTAITISLDTPERMAAQAQDWARHPILKIKCGTPDDLPRLTAIRTARPDAHLLLDANEGWSAETFARLLPELAALNIALIEQPLPAGNDAALSHIQSPIPLYADESAHTAQDIPKLCALYQGVNIKLDKAGGLTGARAMAQAAQAANMKIMLGCMLASSLALAPAILLAGQADWVDLDAPLLLTEDESPPLRYDGALLFPPDPVLWG